MSYEIPGRQIALEAGEDLSSYQFCFVKLDTDGTVIHCDTVGEDAIGVLQNDPEEGEGATVMTEGISKVLAGDVVALNALIKVEVTTGRGITADKGTVSASNVVGSFVQGKALSAAGDGEIFSMLITKMGVAPTTAA